MDRITSIVLLKYARAAGRLQRSENTRIADDHDGPIWNFRLQAEPLRDAARIRKLVGAAVVRVSRRRSYAGVVRRHFNYLTAEYEMKWDAIERSRGTNDFGAGDAIVAFGQAGGMQIKGHALIWHGSVPGWVGALSPADMRAAFESHIRAVAEHYRGRVVAWSCSPRSL